MRRLSDLLARRRALGDVLLALAILPVCLLDAFSHEVTWGKGLVLAVPFVVPLAVRRTRPVVAATLSVVPHALPRERWSRRRR
ncbi:hypothetical protein [Mariniluteicoccus flavus]